MKKCLLVKRKKCLSCCACSRPEPASAVRHSSLFVQSTHRAGFGYSVSFTLRSVDTTRRLRRFGILRFSFSRHIARASAVRCPSFSQHIARASAIHSMGYNIFHSRFQQPDILALKPYTRDLCLPYHTNLPTVSLSVFHPEKGFGSPKCCS